MHGSDPNVRDLRLEWLRSSTARRILAYLARQPVRSARRVAEVLELGLHPVEYHVNRLLVLGLVSWEGESEMRFLAATDDALPFLEIADSFGSYAFTPAGGYASGGHGRPPRPEFSTVASLRARQERPSFGAPGAP